MIKKIIFIAIFLAIICGAAAIENYSYIEDEELRNVLIENDAREKEFEEMQEIIDAWNIGVRPEEMPKQEGATEEGETIKKTLPSKTIFYISIFVIMSIIIFLLYKLYKRKRVNEEAAIPPIAYATKQQTQRQIPRQAAVLKEAGILSREEEEKAAEREKILEKLKKLK